VTITGSGRGSGPGEDGVVIFGSTVQATSSGAVSIKGSGSASGNGFNFGVYLSDSSTKVRTVNGALTISGTGAGSSSSNIGIDVANQAVVQATGSGSVALTGKAPPGTAAIFFDTSGTGLKVGTGNIVLTGDVIDLGAAGSISSTSSHASHLFFQALTTGRALVLGGSGDAAGALTFTTADLQAINQAGFGLITLGAPGSGPISLASNLTGFSTNVTLRGASLSLGHNLGTAVADALTLLISGAVTPVGSAFGTLSGNVSLHAGQLVTSLGTTLHVVGSIALNSTPLVITGPVDYLRNTGFAIVTATTQVSGLFAGFPASTFVLLGSTRYYSSYSTTAMTLTSTGPSTGPR
jgi:hypothetical protein